MNTRGRLLRGTPVSKLGHQLTVTRSARQHLWARSSIGGMLLLTRPPIFVVTWTHYRQPVHLAEARFTPRPVHERSIQPGRPCRCLHALSAFDAEPDGFPSHVSNCADTHTRAHSKGKQVYLHIYKIKDLARLLQGQFHAPHPHQSTVSRSAFASPTPGANQSRGRAEGYGHVARAEDLGVIGNPFQKSYAVFRRRRRR